MIKFFFLASKADLESPQANIIKGKLSKNAKTTLLVTLQCLPKLEITNSRLVSSITKN
jgi:hypothetical protein